MGSVDYEVWLWVKSLVIGDWGLRCLVVSKVTGNWGVWTTRFGCWVKLLVIGEGGLRGLVVG